MEPEKIQPSHRLVELDALRFACAVCVMLYHYTFLGYASEEHPSPVQYEAIGAVTKYGYLAVHFFLVVSGYLVVKSALAKTVKEFFISRVTRLYPAYWAAVLGTAISIWVLGPAVTSKNYSELMHVSPTEFVVNMTMLQRFLGFNDLDGVYWSLSYELSFYLIIAILVGWGLRNRLDIVLVIWLGYTALVRTTNPTQTPAFYLLIPTYAPLFAAGMLFYLLQNKLYARWKLYALLAFSYGLCLRSALAEATSHSQMFHTALSPTIISLVITVIFLTFLLLINRKLKLPQWPVFSLGGSLTYPLYLLHCNIGYLLFQHGASFMNKWVLLAGIILLMLVLSYALHRFVEKPGGKMLQKLLVATLR